MNSNSTNIFQSQKQPQKRPQIPHNNVLETLRDVGSGVGNTLKDDVGGKIASDAFAALFGNFPPKQDAHAQNPFEKKFPSFGQEKPKPVSRPEILSPARISEENARIKKELEDVRAELAMLAKSLNNLNQDIQKVIMEVPVNPGIYHVNFFDRLKRILRLMRESVEDSRSWMALSNGKKKQKGYWNSYKKHGTKFGLSADRTPATQTG